MSYSGQLPRQYLIDVEHLAAALGEQPDEHSGNESAPVVVDCRFDLLNPAAGRQAWEAGHIPGAYYADLDRDLAAPRTATSGRHPLPGAEQLSVLFGIWGLTPGRLLVAYDNAGGAVAARLWWLARWAGHERVALLDGGVQAWEQAGRPLSTAQPGLKAGRYPVSPGQLPDMDVREVSAGLASGELRLIDARDPVRFSGGAEPIDPVAGHVPGAVNRPFNLNLTVDGRFKAPDLLAGEFAALLNEQSGSAVSMCGSGVTACHNLFAMALAGLPDATLYVGSWSEWIRDPARPVARD